MRRGRGTTDDTPGCATGWPRNAFADRVLSAHDYAWPDARTEAEFRAAGSALARELRDELGIEVL